MSNREGRYIEPPRQLSDGRWSVSVLPWELEVGDQIVGMPSTRVASRYRYSETDIGSYDQRARYTYEMSDGGTMTYAGDSPAVHVIRDEPPS